MTRPRHRRRRDVSKVSRGVPRQVRGGRPDDTRPAASLPRRSGGTTHTAGLLMVADIAAMIGVALAAGAGAGLTVEICAATVVALAHLRLYRLRLTVSWLDDLPRLATACVVGVVAGLTVHELWSHNASSDRPRGIAMVVGAIAGRAVTYAIMRRRRLRRAGRATVILGTGDVGRWLGQTLLDHPEHGLRLVGYIDSRRRRSVTPPAPLLGRPDELSRLAEQRDIDCVIVTFGATSLAALVDLVRTCERLHCEILVVPRLFELHEATRDTEWVRGLPLLPMRGAPHRRTSWRVKRALDLVAASAALVVLSPVLVACAAAVLVECGPQVIFRQERVGLNGRRFQMLKFRSLRPGCPDAEESWSIASDPRIGPVGRLLRRTSLDELPQLVNVVRGDMSLVGPRPERPCFVEAFSREHPRYHARHRVPTGMTGLAAVGGLRGDTSIADRVRIDNVYIQNWSLWLDTKIMIRSVGAVFGRAGG